MTHDLVWFEIAKAHTTSWGPWNCARLFEEVAGPNDPPYPRLKSKTDDLEVAEDHLLGGDLRAAAVYIRSAFENRLKNICQGNGIEIDYKEDAKDVSADKMWTAILRRHARRVKAKQGEFLDPALIPLISGVRSAVLPG